MNLAFHRQVLDGGDGVCGVAALVRSGPAELKLSAVGDAKAVTALRCVTAVQDAGATQHTPPGWWLLDAMGSGVGEGEGLISLTGPELCGLCHTEESL